MRACESRDQIAQGIGDLFQECRWQTWWGIRAESITKTSRIFGGGDAVFAGYPNSDRLARGNEVIDPTVERRRIDFGSVATGSDLSSR